MTKEQLSYRENTDALTTFVWVLSLSHTYTDHIGAHREREGVEKKERSSETCKACCLKSTINLAVSYTYQVLLFDCASTPGLSSPLITRSGH